MWCLEKIPIWMFSVRSDDIIKIYNSIWHFHHAKFNSFWHKHKSGSFNMKNIGLDYLEQHASLNCKLEWMKSNKVKLNYKMRLWLKWAAYRVAI